ncbi:MAG: nucleotidyltransferase family protein [Anaerorhabdus sp.]
MKVCGIIVEYNPFHNGHIHHIKKAREITKCDILVAVMSGNFVQRGEPAIIDKWKRSEFAIKNGVDIVFELPYIYSTQSASKFARGAINILKRANIDFLVFGSETNNLAELQEMAELSINPDNIKEKLDQGYSYPKSYGLLTSHMGPNDILAVSYLKEIKDSKIVPYTIKRTINYHDLVITDKYASASAIRNAIMLKNPINNVTTMNDVINTSYHNYLHNYFLIIKHSLITLSSKKIKNIFLFSEGIENHLKKHALMCSDFYDFIKSATTRRYTSSRIRRCCIQLINNIEKKDVDSFPSIFPLRPLAINDNGKHYLKLLKEKEISVAGKFSHLPEKYREIEYKTTLVYSLFMNKQEKEDLLKKERGGTLYFKS